MATNLVGWSCFAPSTKVVAVTEIVMICIPFVETFNIYIFSLFQWFWFSRNGFKKL